MLTTDKETARMIAEALVAYGINDIFVSPGSRNSPLIMAMARTPELRLRTVVDERSAAFIAMGFSLVAQRPAVLVCTSGSALLNYASAVSEAHYRKIPLVVISADRPSCWIGQDDSQTLPQPGVFGAMVNCNVSLKGEIDSPLERWEVNRKLNEVLHDLELGRPGPVHINVSFNEPLTRESEIEHSTSFHQIKLMRPYPGLSTMQGRELAEEARGKRILIVGGFGQPSQTLNKAFAELAKRTNIVVLAEPFANISAPGIIQSVDNLFSRDILNFPNMRPDLLVTFGGGLLSKPLKEYLRKANIPLHWHIGENQSLIDSYFSLSRRIEIPEGNFFRYFAKITASYVSPADTFKQSWQQTYRAAEDEFRKNLEVASWSDKVAMKLLLERLPAQWNLQLSNGLSPRIAAQIGCSKFHRRDCNRGVSGIEGSISTALGASLPFKGTTVVVTGDMSMQYDLAALTSPLLSPRLKIVVFNNGGGGIFSKIAATKNLPELKDFLKCELKLPLHQLAPAFGLRYFRAENRESLLSQLDDFISDDCQPTLLEVIVGDGLSD